MEGPVTEPLPAAQAIQGLLPDYDVPPLLEILRTKRLVELDRGFVPVQNIQTDRVMTLLSCDLGHLTEKRLANTMAAKALSHEEVLKEQTRACPSGIRGKEDSKTSRLSILLRKDGAEFPVRTEAVTPYLVFRHHHPLEFPP